MMMVTAIIQPFRLEHVRRELISAGLISIRTGVEEDDAAHLPVPSEAAE